MADGINNKVGKWTVSVTDVYSEELAPIIAFLDAQAGYKAFYWTPPDGVQGLYRCASYTATPATANIRSLSAEFQETFQP